MPIPLGVPAIVILALAIVQPNRVSLWDAARLAAQQEFRIGEGQPIGIGLQRIALVGVVLQFGPGIGQAALGQVMWFGHDAPQRGSDNWP